MRIRGSKKDDAQVDQELITEVRGLSKRLGRVLDGLEGRQGTAELDKVKRELTDMQIEWDREKEKWDREKRDVEHMVGLQRKRADQERELAVKEAELSVREGNLSAKEDAFEERLEAVTDQLREQVEYLRTDIIKAILERLPTFEVKTALDPHRLLAAGKNGHGEGDE